METYCTVSYTVVEFMMFFGNLSANGIILDTMYNFKVNENDGLQLEFFSMQILLRMQDY